MMMIVIMRQFLLDLSFLFKGFFLLVTIEKERRAS